MFAELIEQCTVRAPVTLMFRATLERVYSNDALDRIFAEHRKRQVEGQLLFSTLVGLMAPVVTGQRKSVHAARRDSDCSVSSQAVYDKLGGVEPAVSAALVRDPVEELRQLRQKTGTCLPDPLPGYHSFIIDGKTYDGTEHRLAESRRDSRSPLPGRAVVLLDTRHGLFTDIECSLNAMRCERKLLEPMLERLQPGAVYIADRNFCDGIVLGRISRAGAFFVIRQHAASPSVRELPGRAGQWRDCGTDASDNAVAERRIEIALEDGSWLAVRQVRVRLPHPTRDRDTELMILTNLPAKVAAPLVSEAYRRRWTIESCLGHLAQALNAEIRTLCYPKAAGLCFCLGLALFNILSLLKGLLEEHGQLPPPGKDRAGKPKPVQRVEVSFYYLAHEIVGRYGGLELFTRPRAWKRYATMTTASFARWLKSTAAHAQLRRYKKSPRGPTRPPPKRKFNGARHVASQKLLDTR